MKWNWGTGIVVTFIVFGIAVMAVVFMAVNERVDLVTDDYYEQELRHQDRIDEVERTRANRYTPVIEFDHGNARISFPASMPRIGTHGEVTLYRPSDRRLDRSYTLLLDSTGTHVVSASVLTPGPWRVRVRWMVEDSAYFHETLLLIP